MFVSQASLLHKATNHSLLNDVAFMSTSKKTKRKHISGKVVPAVIQLLTDRIIDIKKAWRDHDHVMAFILLCERMQEMSRPFPSLVIKECLDQNKILPDHVFDELQQRLSQNDDTLSHCKQQCLKTLHDQYPSWRSFLKLMVQYTDLWIE